MGRGRRPGDVWAGPRVKPIPRPARRHVIRATGWWTSTGYVAAGIAAVRIRRVTRDDDDAASSSVGSAATATAATAAAASSAASSATDAADADAANADSTADAAAPAAVETSVGRPV